VRRMTVSFPIDWNYDISSKARPRAVKAAPGDGR